MSDLARQTERGQRHRTIAVPTDAGAAAPAAIAPSDDQLYQAAHVLKLTYPFLKGRLRANQRRTAIATSLLARRGVDIAACDVLEVGCHIGFGVFAVGTTGRRVGLEHFGENVEKARSLASLFGDARAEFHQGTAAALPFEDESFDFVQTHHVIEHMEPGIWQSYLDEMARVLRPGGLCLLSFPHWHYPVEGHYHLPFLHWLPRRMRPRLARWSPQYRRVHEAEKTYLRTADRQEDVSFTEFPKIKRVRTLARRALFEVEDVTREFLRDDRMKALLGAMKQRIAIALARTWICPERKFLLHKRDQQT